MILVADAGDVARLFADVEKAGGAPDVVVYNASNRVRGPLVEAIGEWRRAEQELKDAGILRQEGNTVHKGRGFEAQYSLTPSLTFSEQDAGRQIGGILQAIPVLNKFVGAAEQVKLKQALDTWKDVSFNYTSTDTSDYATTSTAAA